MPRIDGKLIGCEHPRLGTEPLRPLTRETSRGYSLIEFAELIGLPLLPWQKQLAIRGLELNPDGTYRFRTVVVLVGRQSGKTTFFKTLALWRMYIDGARLVVGAAQSLDISREAWQGSVELAENTPALAREIAPNGIRRANGEQCLTLVNGARYRIAATTPGAGRGLSVDLLGMDEIRMQRDWAAWSALSKTTVARPKGQIWAISNAGDDESVVLNQLRESALAQRDETLGLFEWSADPDLAIDDPESWAQGCPGIGHITTEAAIRSSLNTDPPAVFRTEIRCERVSAMDSALDLTGWKMGADSAGDLSPYRDRIAVGLDVALDGSHVTLVAAADLGNGKVRVEPVASWFSTDECRKELAQLLDQINPIALAWQPSGPANALAPILRARRESVELTGNAITAACMGLADLVQSGRVLHNSDSLLDGQIAAASRMRQGDGFKFTRRGAGSCDALYAAAAAVHAAQTTPAAQPRYVGALVV